MQKIYRFAAVAVCASLGVAFAPPPMSAQTVLPPLKIGLIMSFSGGVPWAPKQSAATIGALHKLFGDSAGGRKIQIIERDDTGIAPEVARRQAQELIVQDRVDILVGTNLTPNAIAVAQVSTQAKKPFFIVNSATSNVMKDQPYSARFGFDTQTIVPPLAAYAAKNYGKTGYSIYQNYGPGIDAGKSFEKASPTPAVRWSAPIRFRSPTRSFRPTSSACAMRNRQFCLYSSTRKAAGPSYSRISNRPVS